MKALAIGMLLCMAVPAGAASPTESYLAARDAAIADLQHGGNEQWMAAAGKREKRALDGLRRMVGDLVGPLDISGFPRRDASNIDTLESGDVDFGKLDGVAAKSLDGKTTVMVTTEPLLRAWLKGHRNWWADTAHTLPEDVAVAFRTDDFYTQALSNEAHAFKFAEIPVVARAQGGVAGALLIMFGQDFMAPQSPDTIVVSVVRDGRVYVFSEKVSAKVGQIPACNAAFERDREAACDLLAAYRAAKTKDPALFRKYTSMDAMSDANFRHCFAEHIGTQGYYPALVRQAQALVDRSYTTTQ
jgi:hypothetical protein